jgi:hypothetical protein
VPAKPTSGKISIQTIPAGANVLLNGKSIGATSSTGSMAPFDVKPGQHKVAVSPLEIGGVKYAGMERKVYVEAGKTAQLGIIKLTPVRNITINIAGPGVTVRINGDPYSISGKPLTLSLPEGKVEIRAKSSNGKTLERNLNLRGDNLTINATLE